jgi:hypothetical protein
VDCVTVDAMEMDQKWTVLQLTTFMEMNQKWTVLQLTSIEMDQKWTVLQLTSWAWIRSEVDCVTVEDVHAEGSEVDCVPVDDVHGDGSEVNCVPVDVHGDGQLVGASNGANLPQRNASAHTTTTHKHSQHPASRASEKRRQVSDPATPTHPTPHQPRVAAEDRHQSGSLPID